MVSLKCNGKQSCLVIAMCLAAIVLLATLTFSHRYFRPMDTSIRTQRELNLIYFTNPYDLISDDDIPIPKVIHQMSDTENVSAEYASFATTALSTNPDYQYVFWTDNDCLQLVQKVLPHVVDDYRRLQTQGKSDYCRFLLLHIFGGIYADMDYVFLRSFGDIHAWFHSEPTKFHDELVKWEGGGQPNSSLSFFVSEEPANHGSGIVNIALMGSAPKHSFTREALDQFRGMTTGSVGRISAWFPTYNGHDRVTLLSNKVFAPFTAGETHRFRGEESAFGEMSGTQMLKFFEEKLGRTLEHTIAAHMWGCFYCPNVNKYKQTTTEKLELSSVLPSMIRGFQLIETLQTIES